MTTIAACLLALAMAFSGAELDADSCLPPDNWTDPTTTRRPTADPVRTDLRRDLDSIYRAEEALAEWKCEEVWVRRDTTTESDTTDAWSGLKDALILVGTFLDTHSDAIRWMFIGGALFLVGWIAWKYRDMVDFSGTRPARRPDPALDAVSMPVVREPPIPDDPTDSVMDAWNRGLRRQALSLLYRHSCRFAGSRGAVLRQGAAEGSLAREARNLRDCGHISQEEFDLLDATIRMWSRAAWADQWPDDDTMTTICRRWQELHQKGSEL